MGLRFIPYSVILPVGGKAALVKNYNAGAQTGELRVEVDRDDPNTTQVFAILVQGANASEPTPAPTPAAPGAAIVVPYDTGSIFLKDDFPIANLAQNAPQQLNYTAWYWGYNASNTYTEKGFATFFAIPNPSTIAVNAQYCIWLTYATDPATDLPTYHETITYNRPLFLRIPANVTSINVTPSDTEVDRWTHHNGANYTNYQGRMGTGENVTTAVTDYQNVGGANGIAGVAYDLNRLVGLWEYEDKTTPTTEIDLGMMSTTTLAVPDLRPIGLRLAMHDGYEWTNNDGAINVTLECVPGVGSAAKKKGP